MISDNFESLSKDRLEIMRRLIEDEDLCKCLACNDRNFLEYKISDEERERLPWNRIYPCKMIFGTQQEAGSYITMSVLYDKSDMAPIWKVGRIIFYIFCHKSLIRTDYGVLRTDFMLKRINLWIMNSRGEAWLGKMSFAGMDDLLVDENGEFIGYVIEYRNTEVM